MSESTTIKTVLEYAVMPIQRYEFTCGKCFMIRPLADHSVEYRGGSGSYSTCVHCEPRKAIWFDRT
jgi:hypothetical protein